MNIKEILMICLSSIAIFSLFTYLQGLDGARVLTNEFASIAGPLGFLLGGIALGMGAISKKTFFIAALLLIAGLIPALISN